MRELETQLTSLVITKATIGQLTEIGIPFITNKVRTWHARQKSKSLPSPRRSPQEGTARRKAIFSSGHNRYVRECKLGRYDSTMEDYGELVIQFGYLVLFGVAFPLASVVNLVNNIIEVRTDALKILKLSQRTDADDAADIGAWYPILEFLNVLAVATNVGLLVFTADSIEILFNLSERLNGDTAREWLVKTVCFFSVEHVLLGGKGLAAALVKDVPGRTHRILARQMYDIARWFDLGWREGFRGGGLLRVDERQVELCGKYAEVFEVASEDERM